MDDTGRDQAASLSDQERATDSPLPLPPTPVDAATSGASNAPSPTRHSAPVAPVETFLLDVSPSSDTGASLVAPPATQLPPRAIQTPHMSLVSPVHAVARKRRQNSASLPSEALPTASERPLLSNSQWEREIAGFGAVLNDVLHCVTNRELVAKTAEYMAAFPQHTRRFQIKMKQVLLMNDWQQLKLLALCVYKRCGRYFKPQTHRHTHWVHLVTRSISHTSVTHLLLLPHQLPSPYLKKA